MKTKRIVALALAGALALGAVTPAFAEEAKKVDATVTAEKTIGAYQKVVAAQMKTIKTLQDKKDKLVQLVSESATEMKTNHSDLAVKQGLVEAAQKAIEKQDKDIEDKKVEIKDKEDALTDALKKYIDTYGEKPLANEDRYTDEFNKADKAGDKDAKDLWTKKKADFEAISKIDGELKKLQDNGKEAPKGLRQLILEKNDLVTKKDIAVAEANDAEKKYNASEKKWVQAKVDLQDTEDQLDKEEDVLVRIQKLKGKFTVETVKNETNPKLVALAEKDLVAYFLGRLAEERTFISEATLKELKLDARVLKAYQDVLGTEDSIEAPESKEEESTKPGETKPNEEKPAPVVPGKEDNKATDKKDNKKEEKKADKKSKKAPKTGDIAVLAYAGTAVLAAGAYVASKKRK